MEYPRIINHSYTITINIPTGLSTIYKSYMRYIWLYDRRSIYGSQTTDLIRAAHTSEQSVFSTFRQIMFFGWYM